MGEMIVCEGATCSCSMGAAPAVLSVTSQTIRTVNGMLVATVEDFAYPANVPTFGQCSLLTSQAGGVPTACVPSLASPWTPGSIVQTVSDFAVLTASSTLACVIGGQISVTVANNELCQTD